VVCALLSVVPTSIWPIRDPLELSTLDPPLVSAKDTAGAPIRVTTMNVATSVVLFKQPPS
jgi:hypothetical protein